DILLARHGSNIVEMTQDRRNNLTRVRLADGSMDTASNFLVSLSAMASAAQTPASRISKAADSYSADQLPVSRKEIRFMAKLAGIWAATSLAFVGGLSWAIFTYGDADSLVQVMGTGF
ncbi:MAG: hypothetical protein Q4P23_12470, partial [Micrococcaceae bacterium]|nr:hypothetical protein [Micrococcaceae bacterium]